MANLEHKENYLVILSTLCVTCALTSAVLAYRLISINGYLLPGGIVIFPFSYALEVIVTEVYGYSRGRQLVWATAICGLVFSCVISLVINLPAPPFLKLASEYQAVLGKTIRLVLFGIFANLVGSFTNIYIIAKTKIFMSGEKLWLRIFFSTSIGELALSSIVYFGAFTGIAPFYGIAWMALNGYLFKVIFTTLSIWPITSCIEYINKKEGIDVYDYTTNFNPFRL